ncbi:hypothetical protein [Salinibaculum rarum]|uniref:hypothetical protein n=1 Tax=Salinibaculum rarum TaxID=3058903 RepID=UPI0026602022|nr:hypothetical protein [Salinibaculum sp. KK48]
MATNEDDDKVTHGATDEGYDDDRGLLSRDTGASTSAEPETEPQESDAEPESEVADEPQPTSDSGTTAETKPSKGDDGGSTRGEDASQTASPPGVETGSSPDPENVAVGDERAEVMAVAEAIDTPAVDPSDSHEFPFLFSRKGAQEARDHDWIYFQDHVDDAYQQAKRQAEDIFGDDVTETDVKEAIFIAGLRNFDDAVGTMHEWGCRADE